MTMLERPIPAELMDEQPVPDDELDVLVEAALAAGRSPAELVGWAAEVFEEYDGEPGARAAFELGPEDGTPEAAEAFLPVRVAALAPTATRFLIVDPVLAEWAMRKLAAIEAERAERRELAAQWRAEVDRWEKAELRPLDARAAFFAGHLEDYGRRTREATGKATVKLPSGRIASTGHAERPRIEDQETVLGWAEELPAKVQEAAIKRTAEVQISRLAKLVAIHEVPVFGDGPDGEPVQTGSRKVVTLAFDPETGEPWGDDFKPEAYAIPGVAVEPAGASYRVEPGK